MIHALPRIVPVVESMIALVLADHMMRQQLLDKESTIPRIRDEIILSMICLSC